MQRIRIYRRDGSMRTYKTVGSAVRRLTQLLAAQQEFSVTGGHRDRCRFWTRKLTRGLMIRVPAGITRMTYQPELEALRMVTHFQAHEVRHVWATGK